MMPAPPQTSWLNKLAQTLKDARKREPTDARKSVLDEVGKADKVFPPAKLDRLGSGDASHC